MSAWRMPPGCGLLCREVQEEIATLKTAKALEILAKKKDSKKKSAS
ncbi:hypothetical protein [Thalassococcus lentus]|uniref:Uncharacterized protein n=1 Tax=Thalassococcus lentus TaxID=1210524 RepID=A0ABT4XXE1_9RHOB|nr:hypothetical protein [Thalassococcus lentus]MDA7426636.1 hypothetical protein [Thalassococcus lentus]